MSAGLFTSFFLFGISSAAYYSHTKQKRTLETLQTLVTEKCSDIYRQLCAEEAAHEPGSVRSSPAPIPSKYTEVSGLTWCPTHQLIRNAEGKEVIILENQTVEVREEWTATERRVSNGERNAHIEGQENKEGKENKEPEPVVVEWKRRTVEEIISSSRRGGSVYIDDGSEQRIKVEDKLVGYELFIKLNETFTPHQSPAINVNVSTGNAPQAHPPTRVMGTKQIERAVPYHHPIYAVGTVFLTSDHLLVLTQSAASDQPALCHLGTRFDSHRQQEEDVEKMKSLSVVTATLATIVMFGSLLYRAVRR